MPKYTENCNLILPEQSENYDVEIANTNNKIIDTQLGNKVEKIAGKGLSANDFTNEYKRKLDTLQNIYKFKGSVNSQAELLEITGQNSGDVYNVIEENRDYAWTGLEWVVLGSATNTEDLAKKEYVDTKNAEQDAAIANLNTMQDNIEAEIQPLKENILSNNLFDGKLLTDKAHSRTGIITSAGITTNENYIKVAEGKTITVSSNNKKLACTFLFYDASLTYLESAAGQVNATVPTGASYVAFNVATADLTGTDIMVNYGTEPMEYEEYVNAIAELEKNKANIVNITTGTEFKTGRIIDGKEEYGKRIDIGALPNATEKYVNTGLSGISLTRPIEGVMKNASSKPFNLPYFSMKNGNYSAELALNTEGNTLTVTTNTDFSSNTGFVTLYYTKNS